jgi:hypothetical protein
MNFLIKTYKLYETAIKTPKMIIIDIINNASAALSPAGFSRLIM